MTSSFMMNHSYDEIFMAGQYGALLQDNEFLSFPRSSAT